MGTIHSDGFSDAIVTGLNSLNSSERELFDTSGSPANLVGSNPLTGTSFAVVSGNYIGTSGLVWFGGESNTDQSIGKLIVRVKNISTGSMKSFLTFNDGNDSTGPFAENGATITVEQIDASTTGGPAGLLNLKRNGIAETMLVGTGSTTFDAVIYDGGGTELDRITSISATYNQSTNTLAANNDLTFQNGSGGQWDVEEFQLEEQNTFNAFTKDASLSSTVQDGGSITFTTAQTEINL